ncbi:MAG: CRTAC1 family protein [Myxococcales bacterium]|nr:CRTAC1 family protein [Myxococcales bacterium]
MRTWTERLAAVAVLAGGACGQAHVPASAAVDAGSGAKADLVVTAPDTGVAAAADAVSPPGASSDLADVAPARAADATRAAEDSLDAVDGSTSPLPDALATGPDAALPDAIETTADVPAVSTEIIDSTSEMQQSADTLDTLASDAADAPDANTAPPDLTKPVPQDPTLLPPAPFADLTTDFGFDPLKIHGACVGVADFDSNGRDDFLVIEVSGKKATIHAVLLGATLPVHVFTAFDTTLLLPTTGCSIADMDSDGKPDLIAGGHAGAALYFGDGKGGFVDKSEAWLPYIMDFATLTIAPVDLDGDGDLDLFVGAGVTPVTPSGGGPACGSLVCDYVDDDFVCTMKVKFPEAPQELQDRVLIRGAQLPMTDETKAWNVPLGGIWSNVMPIDIDADGKMDVVVGDDFGAHRLLHNVGGKFTEYLADIGFHNYGHAMGWSVGDLNADGLADLVMADAGPNPVFVRKAKADAGVPFTFVDEGGARGVWGPTWTASTWSPLLADFDHDGRDDLMMGVSIATTLEQFPSAAAGCLGTKQKPYDGHPNPDLLFLSNGSGTTFKPHKFPNGPYSHFAMVTQAVIDLDDDGDLDLVQTRPNVNMTAGVRIMRNDVPKLGKSFVVKVTGKGGNLDALGTVVKATIGGVVRTRWLNGTGGTGGTRSRMAHFGLGGAEKATDVTILWPDGKLTKLGDVAAGQTQGATWP